MPQFLITALDYTDDQGLERRLAARPAHLEGVRKMKEAGNFILGGAMLSPEGKMIGSTLVLEYEDESGVTQWLTQEPYMLQKVWETVDVKPFRVAVL